MAYMSPYANIQACDNDYMLNRFITYKNPLFIIFLTSWLNECFLDFLLACTCDCSYPGSYCLFLHPPHKSSFTHLNPYPLDHYRTTQHLNRPDYPSKGREPNLELSISRSTPLLPDAWVLSPLLAKGGSGFKNSFLGFVWSCFEIIHLSIVDHKQLTYRTHHWLVLSNGACWNNGNTCCVGCCWSLQLFATSIAW